MERISDDQEEERVPFMLKTETSDEKISALLTQSGPELLDTLGKDELIAITKQNDILYALITVTLATTDDDSRYTMRFILELFKTKENGQFSVKYEHTIDIMGENESMSIQTLMVKKTVESTSDTQRNENLKDMLKSEHLSVLIDNIYRTIGNVELIYTRVSRMLQYGPQEWFMVLYGVKKLLRFISSGVDIESERCGHCKKHHPITHLGTYVTLLDARMATSDKPVPYRLDYFGKHEWASILAPVTHCFCDK